MSAALVCDLVLIWVPACALLGADVLGVLLVTCVADVNYPKSK